MNTVVGKVPSGTKLWKVQKRVEKGGKQGWVSQFSRLEKDGPQVAIFPIERFEVNVIRATWGGGTYKVQFYGEEDGKPKLMGTSRVFQLDDAAPTKKKKVRAEEAVPPATSAMSPELQMFLMLQREARADARAEAEVRIRAAELAAQTQVNVMQTFMTRIEQINAESRRDTRGNGDSRALADLARTLQDMNGRLEDMQDQLDDQPEGTPGVNEDGSVNTAAMVMAGIRELKDLLAPVVQQVAAKALGEGAGT